MSVDTDIAIVGGGPVGAALALALRCANGGAGNNDLYVTVLEARSPAALQAAPDARPIALSHGSRLLLERLNAWRGLAPTAIDTIHVSQRGGFGRVALHAQDAGVPALGYVVDYDAVFASLAQALRATDCVYHPGARVSAVQREGDAMRVEYVRNDVAQTLRARLAVVADGGEIDGMAPVTVVDYGQSALTARVRSSVPHHNTAYERFTREGPLALLPFGDDMALVWSLPPAQADALKAADSKAFLAALQEAFGARLGAFTACRQRACYPLILRQGNATEQYGVITIGNAAQTLHPVAGQGFNLGLRDAWELARAVRAVPLQSLGAPQTLHRFRADRMFDRQATVRTTHGLVQLFSNDFFALGALRGVGMTLLGGIAPARDFLARRMIFGVRG